MTIELVIMVLALVYLATGSVFHLMLIQEHLREQMRERRNARTRHFGAAE